MSKQSSGDGSKNISYGETVQKRAWELVEALIDGANSLDTGTKALRVLKWIERSNNLKVVTTLEKLRHLVQNREIFKRNTTTTDKAIRGSINDVLIYCLGAKFLGILHDERGLIRGAEEWNFTLRLWSRDLAKNKEAFDQLWLEKKQARSRQKPSLSVKVTTETVTEVSVVNLPGETDQSTTKPAASTPAKNKKVTLHEAIPAVPVWKGRDELLNDLKTKLLQPENPSKVLALIGQGGIGKTSLAVKLLEALGVNFSSRTVTTDCPYQCAMYFKADVGTSFDEVADFLLIDGLDFKTAEPLKTADEKIAKIIAWLTETRCLLVLDNLESILQPANDACSAAVSPTAEMPALQAHRATSPDWGKLLNALVYQQHQSQTILTSREVPGDLADTRYEGLEPDSELVQIERLAGVSTDAGVEILQQRQLRDKQSDLQWVSERVEGHVFLLTHLAAIGKGKPGYLRKHPEFVTKKAEPILREQLERQSEAARDLLRRMCVLRVGIDVRGLTFLRLYTDDREKDDRFEMAAEMEEPAELTEAEISETEAILERLVDSSLVQCRYDEEKCELFYDLHRVIVEFLQAEYKDELPSLLESVYKFYCTRKNVKNPKTLEDLLPVLEAQYFAFQLGNYSEAYNLIPTDHLLRWGYWNLLKDLYDQMLPNLEDNHHYCLTQIGIIYKNFGDWNVAEIYFMEALNLAQKQGSNRGVSAAQEMLGDIERKRGNWDKAEKLYRQSLELRIQLGDQFNIAYIWKCLGDIERKQCNWDKAEHFYRRSLELRMDLKDQTGIAVLIGCLGANELGRCNPEAAKQLLIKALTKRQELGMTWHIAKTSWDLALLERRFGNTELGQQHYNTAHQIFQQLGAAKDLERIEREWESD